MNTREQKTINDVQTIQAVMKEHQKTMQKDIDELKTASKEINEKLDKVTSTLDAITAGRKVLIWLATFTTAIAAVVTAWVNGHAK